MTKIYLIRHGEVALNKARSYIGSTDLPLNDTGRSQAALLARRMEGEDIAAVYSSDLSRARETAEIVAEGLGLGVIIVPAFREADYGEWEGMPEIEIPKKYPEVYKAWRADPAGTRIPGGETMTELRDRAYPAFCQIVDQHPDESIAIVAHKSTNRILICCMLGIDVNRYRQVGQVNAALNVIEKRADGAFVADQINESCHLTPSAAR